MGLLRAIGDPVLVLSFVKQARLLIWLRLLVLNRSHDHSFKLTSAPKRHLAPWRAFLSGWCIVTLLFFAQGAHATLIESHTALDYDTSLFDELNMLETLQTLFRSCFKDSFIEIKEQMSQMSLMSSQERSMTGRLAQERLVGEIFTRLLDRDSTKLSAKFLDLTDSVCQSSHSVSGLDPKSLDLINKLFVLSDYEHYLCGNIFRNAIAGSHLENYVLKLNENEAGNVAEREDQPEIETSQGESTNKIFIHFFHFVKKY
jgi:hypothetical protein